MSFFHCGIDFGTSNSSIAVASADGKPYLVAVEDSQPTIPSTVFYEPGHLPLFGHQALSAYLHGREGRFMRSLKRVLGTDLMLSGTIVNGKSVKFENILAQFVGYLKHQAEENVKDELTDVVMGRPVHFRDNDEKGDREAERQLENIARRVGFKNIVFQYEPIAAAFAHEPRISGEKLACVIDIGGGTSDFSIIRIGTALSHKSDRSDDILASSGIRIGGNDFDKSLSLRFFMPSLGLGTTYGAKSLPVPTSQYFDLSEWSKVNSAYTYQNRKVVTEVLSNAHCPELYGRLLEVIDREKGHVILGLAEKAKIALTDDGRHTEVLEFLSGCPKIISERSEFEQAINLSLDKISDSVKECLRQAETSADKIELIILTGGSTEIPHVRQVLCAHFPQAEISSENKMSSVGLGLAYDSIRRF